MGMFSPTLDWSNELLTSLIWIAKGWAIAAVCTLAVLALLVRFTTWGRQYWRITSGYFTGADSIKVWVWLAALLLSVITGVRLSVLFTYQGNDMMTSFQVIAEGVASGDEAVRTSGKDGFWMSLTVFTILAALNVGRIMLDLFMAQRFMLAWRQWLTARLTSDWLDGKAYYRSRFIDDTIDNPDQRIQTDIDIFTAGVGPTPNTPNNTSTATLLFGAVNAIASMISFTAILWNLSGNLTLPLIGVELPRAMFFIGILYVVVATVIAFWIGRPIIWLAFDNEKFNAAFRYALVRMRDAAEAVAFYRGEFAERTGLRRLFAPVVSNYKRYINRMAKFYGWNLSVSQAQELIPYIVQFPRFFNGEVTLGGLTQTASAFRNLMDGLSFFRNAYDQFAGYRAAIIRLHGLVVANEEARALPEVTTTACVDGTVELKDVEVRTPDGRQLIKPLDMRLEVGDTLVITGPSGSGKTTLLRSLAELWPFTSGTLTRPCGPNETMFLSQMPYVPLGDLRAVVTYPAPEGSVSDEKLAHTLNKVALPHLVERLDEVQDWAKVLSPGEQQRIAFARILLTKPKVVFLDESTSALDEGLEFLLYQLVRTELPDTILVSVSHRTTVEQHHTHELQLLGDGDWRLGRTNENPKQALV
ncbi:ABC transporter ATP-binding protein/permease [Mycolicibacterium smegmatis]|uniref:ABC transporter domain protein n=3 Tax=Mycolicibacterium smegmatis TaxID=1772 RepID=I7GA58_MYCS2|nr:ABC transporter ATP-binding protein/permease [Mycolicibacterium smegmatis]ABK71890.1 ABC transporter, permease/ATP-binding protein [Mycolicibacterium smegmatis MC2 155]AFP40031.1 ABC transporter domain protein [Mycolicibacterium smegmatis MC2 155]AIU08788.1 multidrug ABC transporter ATP-binding protein [Mycolicibacterium smegmatis MC2 155]AIU15413.1 multidrug ABC transporter ATP-binding protein [Mycolicibacterium smegmatis]AIU22036.1 multidrug ABC transporter ATP-binding protein [Mycoliciba